MFGVRFCAFTSIFAPPAAEEAKGLRLLKGGLVPPWEPGFREERRRGRCSFSGREVLL